MSSITLLIDGQNKTFTVPFISGMVWRKFIDCRSRMDMSKLKPEELDELAGLVVYAYSDKFTLEQFYGGVPHDKVMAEIDALFKSTDQGKNGKK